MINSAGHASELPHDSLPSIEVDADLGARRTSEELKGHLPGNPRNARLLMVIAAIAVLSSWCSGQASSDSSTNANNQLSVKTKNIKPHSTEVSPNENGVQSESNANAIDRRQVKPVRGKGTGIGEIFTGIVRPIGQAITTVWNWGPSDWILAGIAFVGFWVARGAAFLQHRARVNRDTLSAQFLYRQRYQLNFEQIDRVIHASAMWEPTIDKIWTNENDASRIYSAQSRAEDYPEWPFLLFPKKDGLPLLRTLRTAISANHQPDVANAALTVAHKNLVDVALFFGDSVNPKYFENLQMTHNEHVLVALTYEKRSRQQLRAILLPPAEVLSVLASPAECYESAKHSDERLQGLVALTEFAITVALYAPGELEPFASQFPNVWEAARANAQALRRMLVLKKDESFEFFKCFVSLSKDATHEDRAFMELSDDEERKYKEILSGGAGKWDKRWHRLKQFLVAWKKIPDLQPKGEKMFCIYLNMPFRYEDPVGSLE